MKQLMAPAAAIAVALAISACGGGGGGSSGSSAAPMGGADTVAVRQLTGLGSVLVDGAGKPIYTSDVEASGRIVCDGSCTVFWKPVTAAGGMPTGGAGAGKLGVIKRPDGKTQVTANGRPLYTFSEDSSGKATGDGFTDDFDGHHFTWHVVRSGGSTSGGSAGAAKPADRSPGGYGY
jgi:predicted lipoprotein with Yx(FWY)xxD motif